VVALGTVDIFVRFGRGVDMYFQLPTFGPLDPGLCHLTCRTQSWAWVSNGRFGFHYGLNSGGEVLNSSPCYSNLQQTRTEIPFLATGLETHPAPLPMMLVAETTTHVLGEVALAMMAINRRFAELGQTLSPARRCR
jgi:hypothetical protein